MTNFDKFANVYDLYNNLISLGTHKLVKEKAISLLNIEKNSYVLDLCTGTGDIAKIIKQKYPCTNVIGIDISVEMLKIASQQVSNVTFLTADVCNIPFDDNFFDITTISFGLRNIENRKKALEEIYRVLKNGGQFLHIDFAKTNLLPHTTFKLLAKYASIILQQKVPYRYFLNSIDKFPNEFELISEIESIGFNHLKSTRIMFGVISAQLFYK